MKVHVWCCLVFICFLSCENNVEKEVSVNLKSNQHFSKKPNGLYLNDSLYSGQVLDYHKPHVLKSQLCYLNGSLHGTEKHWYSNGQLGMYRRYNNGIKIDTHRGWWQNGNKKFTYPINKKGRYQGEVKEWYESGQQFKSFNFENGKEKGSQKLWKSDGRIKANYVIKNGQKYGLIGLKRCYNISNDSIKR
jgi:antitoxin component YwqK of YwqJK toxin-antitoxin module